MIIKELIDLGKATTRSLKKLECSDEPDGDEIEFLRHKLSALRELQNYAFSGDWTREASRKKFAVFVKSKFDYELTAKRFNTTRASLNVFVARQDKRLERIIGDAISLIEQDRIDEGLNSFYVLSGIISSNEFKYKISELLPEPEYKEGILVSDCAEEVMVLRSLMRSGIREQLKAVDPDRLSYLMYLLNADKEELSNQRKELAALLRANDD